ncbi:hypothetical protein BXZ70DRAFT_903440 [Cristinia sonorae]|uniref:Uncharacterized protein n=1 Tax=Cristinia sonorae TaxID=1940300 RepID=A0A8K0UYW6_9AGAR|nr:hypothetical protein BXZ70DRAFT_903440 [Cristinia sonorae]
MSKGTEALIFPSSYDAGRKWLFLHGFYGVVGGVAGCLYPDFTMEMMDPMLTLIEQYTGLPHFYPTTVEENRLLVYALAFAIGIGAIYLVYAGPLWNRGGKALVEGSIWTRIAYVLGAYALCFGTPYGSSLLFSVATVDVLSIFAMKFSIGASWGDLVRGQTRIVNINVAAAKKK